MTNMASGTQVATGPRRTPPPRPTKDGAEVSKCPAEQPAEQCPEQDELESEERGTRVSYQEQAFDPETDPEVAMHWMLMKKRAAAMAAAVAANERTKTSRCVVPEMEVRFRRLNDTLDDVLVATGDTISFLDPEGVYEVDLQIDSIEWVRRTRVRRALGKVIPGMSSTTDRAMAILHLSPVNDENSAYSHSMRNIRYCDRQLLKGSVYLDAQILTWEEEERVRCSKADISVYSTSEEVLLYSKKRNTAAVVAKVSRQGERPAKLHVSNSEPDTSTSNDMGDR